MTKIKTVKKVDASEVVQPSSIEPTTTAAPATPAPAPTVVAAMTDPAVQECASLLDQVSAKLGSETPLNADQIRRATKMRKGGAEVIPKILALCEQHGVTKIGTLTTTEMSAQLKRGDALVQVGLRGAVVQKKVKDSAMGAHGRTWQIGMTMYKTLQRMAVDDPELALGLEPIEGFFQTKKTKGLVRKNKKASAAKKLAKEQAATEGGGGESVVTAPVVTTPVVAAPVVATPVVATTGNGAASNGANGAAAAATTPVS